MAKQPPEVNGVIEGFTDEEVLGLQQTLDLIIAGFVPTDETPVCDTFYITSTYNSTHEFKLNGDTVQYLLGVSEEGGEV